MSVRQLAAGGYWLAADCRCGCSFNFHILSFLLPHLAAPFGQGAVFFVRGPTISGKWLRLVAHRVSIMERFTGFGMAQKPAQIAFVQSYSNIKKLTDDLWIAQRSAQQKPTWYLYKIGRNFTPRSLKTKKEDEARTKAFQIYAAYLKDPAGRWYDNTDLDLHRKTFKELSDEWLACQSMDKDNKAANIRKFLIPFFHYKKKLVSIGQIDEAMIDDYKFWRRCFWLDIAEDDSAERQKGILINEKQRLAYDDEPSPNTLNREYPTLRGILEYARKRGYFGRYAVPDVKADNAKANPRVTGQILEPLASGSASKN